MECLRTCSSYDLTNLTGSRLSRTRALLKAFRSRFFTEVPGVCMTSTAAQTFLMLRPSASHEWSCFSFWDFWYNHCVANRRTEAGFSEELSAEDFNAIGDTLALPYGGTFRHCHGDIASFASVAADLPHYPFDVQLRLRATYWKFKRACGAEDLIPASLDSLLLSIVHCIHGLPQTPDPTVWEKAFHGLARIACDDDLGRQAVLQQLSEFFQHTAAAAWSVLPASLARPMLLTDYQILAARVGYRYCGVSPQPDILATQTIPPTITSSRCIFLPLESQASLETCREDFWKQAIKSSYLRLHMAWQARVPTFAKMRRLVQQLLDHPGSSQLVGDASDAHSSLLQKLVPEFRSAPHSVVQTVFLEVMAARGLRECDDCISAEALEADLALLSPELQDLSAKNAPASESAFQRVLELRQTELQIGCDTLTHPTPPIPSELCHRRASQALSTQLQVVFLVCHTGIKYEFLVVLGVGRSVAISLLHFVGCQICCNLIQLVIHAQKIPMLPRCLQDASSMMPPP